MNIPLSPDTPHHIQSAALATLRHSFERFAPLSDAIWAEIRKPWRIRKVNRGDLLTREGETEDSFSLIVEGAQRVYFITPDGDDHTIAFAYPPDYSGVPDSFFLQTPSAYAIEALSEGYILVTSYTNFSALMERHREIERWAWRFFMHALSGRFKRERELLTLTAQERYERLLRESPQIVQLAALRHVASYLGMSPETLSRVRAATS